VWQQTGEQFIRLQAVVGSGGFEQCDGFGHGTPLLHALPVQDAVDQRRGVTHAQQSLQGFWPMAV
jgi:hypothetical protein